LLILANNTNNFFRVRIKINFNNDFAFDWKSLTRRTSYSLSYSLLLDYILST